MEPAGIAEEVATAELAAIAPEAAIVGEVAIALEVCKEWRSSGAVAQVAERR